MAKKTVTITAPGGFLSVDTNLVKLSKKDSDVIKWDVKVDAEMCVEIVFHCQSGTVGPFAHVASAKNPARGWYKVHGSDDVESNALDQTSGMWKYDVVLYECETGHEIDRKDPYVFIKT
jgi:hypothetical protein